ncbi:E3 ubiquitin-protein ligase rnf146 [Tetranychus urticae]|uniref:E3 ubiquitin-protein ligase n=1 Tax=Tetranychus urticae TaxID=32264 RepID=T1JUS6_TETUR|nr:E3 ubiquitin-protein ligase rnf146 [Tetranychus urticae]
MSTDVNCPVCLSKPNIPVVLGCNHLFCYLCLKGSSNAHMKCPICRRPYPSSVFTKPDLKEKSIQLTSKSAKWSYQGRGGYWLFDKLTNRYMENAYQDKKPNCEVVIAGNSYVIDFNKMIQFRKDIPGKRRHIKRTIDLDRNEIKGVAGVSQKLLKVKVKKQRCDDLGEGTSSSCQPSDTQNGIQNGDNNCLSTAIARSDSDEIDIKPDVSSIFLTNVKEEIVDIIEEGLKIKQEPNLYDEDTQ